MFRFFLVTAILLVISNFIGPHLSDVWLGLLPGDMVVRSGDTVLYLPIVSCLLASAVIMLLIKLIKLVSWCRSRGGEIQKK